MQLPVISTVWNMALILYRAITTNVASIAYMNIIANRSIAITRTTTRSRDRHMSINTTRNVDSASISLVR